MTYRIHAVRLINFHNFVDETVELRDGGHLFLLGDNGSGKTTVLDAIHLVLAGGELELNAAARLGGRRDDGRSLQGIVLRYDFERGVRNAGGAIAYAAVELVDAAAGRHLTVGIGAEATTMEARVARWGFAVPRPLREVALLDDEARPLDRDGLRRQLGAAHVHGTLVAYRRELARRLFGSDAQHDEAVRFWGMAKAYREIVAGARDFGALFERLLPAPDGAVFHDILRTLRAIEDLEVAVRDLDDQRGYVAGLRGRVDDVAAARELAARYRWLACRRELDEATDAGDAARADAARWRDERARRELAAEAARLGADAADAVLRRAESDDAAGVLAAVRDAEARRRELAVDAAAEARRAADARGERARRDAVAARERAELAGRARAAAAELRAAAGDAAPAPGALGATARLAEALEDEAAATAPLPATADAASEAAALDRDADAEARRARHAVDAADARLAEVSRAVAALEATHEATPAVPGLAEARAALADAGIAAATLCEQLEPRAGVAPAALAAIEALVGDAALGALLVATDDDADREAARRLVARVAPHVRVVVLTAGATTPAELPAWCDEAIAPATEAARRALAAALSQPAALGEVTPPDDGAVALRGFAHRVVEATPRLLGAAARRLAHQARVDEARAARAEAERDRAGAARHAQAAERRAQAARRLVAAVAATDGARLIGAWHAAAAAAHAAALAAEVEREAETRAAALARRLAGVDEAVAALRARADGVDLAALERRLAAVRAAADAARARWRDAERARAAADAEIDAADARLAGAGARVAQLAADLAERASALRAALAAAGLQPFAGDDAALAHHVRVTQRGDAFRGLDNLRQRLADAERAGEAAADELDRDGSRGVRFLAHAARFGFTYDRARNHVEDRRGQPLAGVLAELDRTLAEQRTVINEHTRTLMDTLVMGELARHLQGQVHHLHETVKGINRVLRGLRFGPSEYQFQVSPRPDRAEIVDVVGRLSLLDEDSRRQFRAWIDGHLDELRAGDDATPPLLDYRRWFEFKLRMSTTDAEGVELTHRLRQVGSGGEQGVPNYLLVLSLAHLMFDAAGAAVRPLLFDEAFYGIDAGRRDQLLRLATDLGLQLVVASPDQDGATAAVRAATTLFVVKDADHDVHLAPYHYWNTAHAPQADLFTPPPDPAAAVCRG